MSDELLARIAALERPPADPSALLAEITEAIGSGENRMINSMKEMAARKRGDGGQDVD